ncbi:hypothetical protein ACOME3_000445 [Neoechinorhynchus agilis]
MSIFSTTGLNLKIEDELYGASRYRRSPDDHKHSTVTISPQSFPLSTLDPVEEDALHQLRLLVAPPSVESGHKILMDYKGSWSQLLFRLLDTDPPLIFAFFSNLKQRVFDPLIQGGIISFHDLWSLFCNKWTHQKSRTIFLQSLADWTTGLDPDIMGKFEFVLKGINEGDSEFRSSVLKEVIRIALKKAYDQRRKAREILSQSTPTHVFELFNEYFNDLYPSIDELLNFVWQCECLIQSVAFSKPPALPSTFSLIFICQCHSRSLNDWFEQYALNDDGLKEMFMIELLEFVFDYHLSDYKSRLIDHFLRNKECVKHSRIPKSYMERFEHWYKAQSDALIDKKITTGELVLVNIESPKFLDKAVLAMRLVLNGLSSCDEQFLSAVGNACGYILNKVNDIDLLRPLLVQILDGCSQSSHEVDFVMISCFDKCREAILKKPSKFGDDFSSFIANKRPYSQKCTKIHDSLDSDAYLKLQSNSISDFVGGNQENGQVYNFQSVVVQQTLSSSQQQQPLSPVFTVETINQTVRASFSIFAEKSFLCRKIILSYFKYYFVVTCVKKPTRTQCLLLF